MLCGQLVGVGGEAVGVGPQLIALQGPLDVPDKAAVRATVQRPLSAKHTAEKSGNPLVAVRTQCLIPLEIQPQPLLLIRMVVEAQVDNALYNAFGQRQVATIYGELNQYKVIMQVAPRYIGSPEALKDIYVPARNTAAGSTSTTASVVNPALRDPSAGQALSTAVTTMVPLSAIASFSENSSAASISHEDGELSTTISYNLATGSTLSDAQAAVSQAEAAISLPNNVRGSFSGTALSAQQSQGEQPLLILAALVVIYIVLGILYESLIHPLTVISTLPSAGVGALLALLLFKMDLSIIALIGIFLLIGIVKKNAILIIDFALDAERARGLSAVEAVREACLLRFRPILMTTMAAILGALPLAIGFGEGAELRRPLGITIIGGLIASQLLTLLTTPVVYVLLDKLRRRSPSERQLSRHPHDLSDAPPSLRLLQPQ